MKGPTPGNGDCGQLKSVAESGRPRVRHFTSMWKRIFRVIICRFTALHSWVSRRGKENVLGMSREVLVFRYFHLRTGSVLMEHCMQTKVGVRCLSRREVKLKN